ncbi:MAG: magnesium transporter CorA family protein [Rhodobacteraceae bacterium]|nr:magnesium transporter CorA family protein [Paracoccaceae bacterium]
MLSAYGLDQGRLFPLAPDADAPTGVWFDLLNPTLEEERALEARLGVNLPTREEMQEIEISSRLYQEDGATFMTANVLARTDTAEPELAPVTFVLTGGVLTTVRYHEPRAFQIVTQRAERNGMPCENAEQVLLALLEAIVDRIADVLEREGALLDRIARSIFRRDGQRRLGKVDLGGVLEEVGLRGELNSKIQESLITMDRIAGFLGQMALAGQRSKTARARVKTLARDARSLADHAGFQAQKITFLLDATLGLVNIEQNGIIKIFSVAAVVFLPPTLVASIYGMNFAYMPELGWRLGYPWALGLMVASAVLPYLFFKRKGWL